MIKLAIREEEKELLEMDQYEFIRTGYRVYGKSISEFSRITGRLRNTIKKAIRGEPWGYNERKHQAFPVLGPYMGVIDRWLEGDRQACLAEIKGSPSMSSNW